jgi:hypothetical protein
VHIVLEN